MTIRQTALLIALSMAGPGSAQAPAQASGVAPASPPPAPALVASKDFPKGTATPSAECGACHQAIFGEYAEGFGSDMRYPGLPLRTKGDKVLELPAGSSVGASAHAIAELTKPVPRPEAQGEGLTCAACHLTPEGTIRGPHQTTAPHQTVAEPRVAEAEMCASCHAIGKRIPGKQTQTYLEWREDFFLPGLGKQQCQDCHMPRTLRKSAEDSDVPVRAVARHLWTGGHSGQRLGSVLALTPSRRH